MLCGYVLLSAIASVLEPACNSKTMLLKEVNDIKAHRTKLQNQDVSLSPGLHHGTGLIKCRHLAIAKMFYDRMVYSVSTEP